MALNGHVEGGGKTRVNSRTKRGKRKGRTQLHFTGTLESGTRVWGYTSIGKENSPEIAERGGGSMTEGGMQVSLNSWRRGS